MADTVEQQGILQRRKPREGSWTKADRATFLAELAMTCNVHASCRVVGKDPATAYWTRQRDGVFAAAWDAALEQGYDRLEAELVSRALGDVGAAVVAAERDGGAAGAPVGSKAAPAAPFDPELALKILARRRPVGGTRQRSPKYLKQPTRLEVMVALDRRLTAMEKRLGRGPVAAIAGPETSEKGAEERS